MAGSLVASSSENQLQSPRLIFILQLILVVIMSSVFWFPKEEQYFPLSRFPMFANHRPKLEPLAYIEVQFNDGSHKRVPVQHWNRAGSSNVRTQLQSLSGKRMIERHRFCMELTSQLSPWFEKQTQSVTELRIVGGRFRRTDVLSPNPVEPVNFVVIHSCPVTGISQ